jgi:hypothetical protein
MRSQNGDEYGSPPMKKILLFVCVFSMLQFETQGQELQWKTALNYFFDNTEYAKSTLTKDQTMTGVHFSPELGVKWDSVHSIYTGVDLLKISGSKAVLDVAYPIAYYKYQKNNITFLAGAFQREDFFSNYSDLFFRDSITYYHPTIQGFIFQIKHPHSFFNLWMDWTGHQTALHRETFFVGTSAYRTNGLLFIDFQSYMFHFANTRPSTASFKVCDNVLARLSLGVNFSKQTGLDTLLFSAGVLAGFERDRGISNGTHTPIGAVLNLNVEHKGFGTQNMLYIGQDRNVFYSTYTNSMYWNNPFLRSGFYVQSKWYYNFIHTLNINAKIGMNLHLSEGKLMFQQLLTVKAMIDNTPKTKPNHRAF